MVVEATGFVYAPERPKEDTFVGQKWGWTAKKAGKITLLLNVTCVVHVSAGGGWTAKKAGALLLAGCVPSAWPMCQRWGWTAKKAGALADCDWCAGRPLFGQT